MPTSFTSRLSWIFALTILWVGSGISELHAQRVRRRHATPLAEDESPQSVTQGTEQSGISMRDMFSRVKDKLIIVQGDDSVGSGFVMEMGEGKKYFVTNKHVVDGQKRVAAFRLDGKELHLGSFEVAVNRDLVRFELPITVDALKAYEGTPNIHDNVYVFGNSDGAGVATDLSGQIVGVGPDDVEVSVPFVQGNSGSAVLNEQGEVIGVATYAIQDTNPDDWTKKGSRFSDVRRFAVRFINVEWKPMKYEVFYKTCIENMKKRQQDATVAPQVSVSFFNPALKCNKPQCREGRYAVKSEITLSMRGGTAVKTPIVRLSVLIRSERGEYCFKDCILTEPGSQRTQDSPPVYKYGNTSSRRYPVGNGFDVFFLEGLSYHQLPFRLPKLGIQYFNKVRKRYSVEEYLFSVPKNVSGKKPPEILCFRLECWQNGALAGVFNSKSPAALNGKGIPVDWFIRDKYPSRINYTILDSD